MLSLRRKIQLSLSLPLSLSLSSLSLALHICIHMICILESCSKISPQTGDTIIKIIWGWRVLFLILPDENKQEPFQQLGKSLKICAKICSQRPSYSIKLHCLYFIFRFIFFYFLKKRKLSLKLFHDYHFFSL